MDLSIKSDFKTAKPAPHNSNSAVSSLLKQKYEYIMSSSSSDTESEKDEHLQPNPNREEDFQETEKSIEVSDAECHQLNLNENQSNYWGQNQPDLWSQNRFNSWNHYQPVWYQNRTNDPSEQSFWDQNQPYGWNQSSTYSVATHKPWAYHDYYRGEQLDDRSYFSRSHFNYQDQARESSVEVEVKSDETTKQPPKGLKRDRVKNYDGGIDKKVVDDMKQCLEGLKTTLAKGKDQASSVEVYDWNKQVKIFLEGNLEHAERINKLVKKRKN